MGFVITEPCIGVKDASCVDVCPVDCIHSNDEAEQFYIDGPNCIDCAYCETVCPVQAIFDTFNVPPKWDRFIGVNREFFKK
jgi:ferredoxin